MKELALFRFKFALAVLICKGFADFDFAQTNRNQKYRETHRVPLIANPQICGLIFF
jgi:hypothetical protein